MSEGIEVFKSIAAITGALAKEGISKDRKNQQQGFAYRGIDDVYSALSPLLAANNLCILPRVTSKEVVERINAKGTALFYTTVSAEFDIVSSVDGSRHTVSSYGEAMDSGDKSIGKAMSYAYKAMAFMTFAIPTEGDNDPDATVHEVKPQQRQQQKTNQQAAKSSQHPVELSKAQKDLLQELATAFNGNVDEMGDALRTVSAFQGSDGERWLKLAELEKPNSNEKFQRWVGASLGKLRKG